MEWGAPVRNTSKPIALVVGAGANIGGAIAQRFAAGGYPVCVARRSDFVRERTKARGEDPRPIAARYPAAA